MKVNSTLSNAAAMAVSEFRLAKLLFSQRLALI
jgi:hypothetical protein